jgi:hypothetical protein
VVTKFPLVAGLFALVFAMGSLFGVKQLGAGSTAFLAREFPVFTDCAFWVGMMSFCLVIVAVYRSLLVKLGIVADSTTSTSTEQKREDILKVDVAGATVH